MPVCCPDGWTLIYAGSQFTIVAESTYAPTEGETLVLSRSLQNSRLFTLGCPELLVAADHKPLLGIFNDRDLDRIVNPRIHSFKESTISWRFSVTHCLGKWARGPDALSHYLCSFAAGLTIISEPKPETDSALSDQVLAANETSVILTFQELHAVTFDDVINAAHSDHQYQDLLKIVSEDFPTKHSLTEPTHLQEFWEVGDRLST